MDPDAFEEADLEVLKERPWQQMWNMYLQDLNFWRETFGGGTGLMLRVGDLFVKNRTMKKDDEVGETWNSKCITEEDHRGPRSIIRMQSQLVRMEKHGSRSHALHVSGKLLCKPKLEIASRHDVQRF